MSESRGQTDYAELLRLSVRAADAKIEMAADEVLRRCLSGQGLEQPPLPIPIEEWIESPLGYDFGVVSQDKLGEGVLGKSRPATGEILVSEDLLENEGRYRFTCAHELAHLVLHADLKADWQDGRLPHGPEADRVEHEADRFASAMLMPLSTLPSAIEEIRRENELRPEVLAMLRGDDVLAVWLWRECFLPALVKRYGVSRAAIVYRLREVRLPRQRRLLRPSLIPLLLAPEEVVAALNRWSIVVRCGLPTFG